MKLRVRLNTADMWVIERRVMWGFWVPLTKAMIFLDRPSHFSRQQFPLIFDSLDAAKNEARRLLVPGELEKHNEEHKQKWKEALLHFERVTPKKTIIEID